jgi:hypothetical protein
MLDDVRPLVTALITAAVTIVGAATPLVVAYLRSYFSVKENAAMNQTVAASASREAAMLLSSVPDIRQVSAGDPLLVSLAQDLLRHYPEYTDKLGIDAELAQHIILGEAHKLYNTGLVPVASVSASVAAPGVNMVTASESRVTVRRVPKE